MRKTDLILLAALAAALPAGAAHAFCVQNDGTLPLVVQAGGPPMPIYVKPNLKPGERDCHVPRRPEGITVEIFDGRTRQLRCRLSVPAKDATIVIDNKSCRTKLG